MVKRTVRVNGGSKFEVSSAGYKSGNTASILVNDKEVLTKKEAKRGMNIVVFDFVTHKEIAKKSYDTYGDDGASAQMLKDFEELPRFAIITVAVKDEATRKLSKDVKALFKKMGSKSIKNLAFRDGWVFIGIKGMKKAFADKRGPSIGTAKILGYGKITKRTVKRTRTVRTTTKTTKTVTKTEEKMEKKVEKVEKEVPQKVKGGSRLEIQSLGGKGGFALINVAGKSEVKPDDSQRGLNVVALDPMTHKVVMNNAYDTSGDKSASAQFVEDFKSLPHAAVMLVGVSIEAKTSLSSEATEIFSSMGSTEVSKLETGNAWAFIGVKGTKKFVEKRGDHVGTGAIMGYAQVV